MVHTEGGWPKDVDCTEAEHVIRYRKKVEKDEDYVRSIVNLGAQACLFLNNILNNILRPPSQTSRTLRHHRDSWRRWST